MKAYRLGNPFNTGAVVEKPARYLSLKDFVAFKSKVETDKITLQRNLAATDIVLGLGEQLGGINKRGRRYVTYNNDTPHHTPDKLSLYASHPFLAVNGNRCWGIFLDFAGEIRFDIGFTQKDLLQITIMGNSLELYYWEEKKWQNIVTSYIALTGGVYIPPRWAFGYQQSRWSYPDAPIVKETADKFRQLGIPCDAIYLDIDYMQDYKVFTVDEDKFPDFAAFTAQMKQKGFHLVPIIDPGVKIEEGYPVYDEGKEKHYFCTDTSGEEFKAAVWPGLTHFPDFLQSDVRLWWGKKYDKFIKAGIEGFWNDMNEPAIFYSEKRKNEIFRKLQEESEQISGNNLNLNELAAEISDLHNSKADYCEITHHPSADTLIPHNEVHCLYGAKMTLAFSDYVDEHYPERRFLIFSRSSYSGSQRYSGIWFGDNKSWWEHLELNIKMLVNCHLLGYFYSGADIGGFGEDCHSELLIRWLQLGVFSPLMRNHSALGTRPQEPWQFDKDTLKSARSIIRLRYALLPWLYSQFLEFAAINIPLIRPVFWDFSDSQSKSIEDQFIYGNGLMIAPIYKQNSSGRFVYLPEDNWLLWKVKSWDERDMKFFEPGNHFIECPLDRQLVFLRENYLLAMQQPEEYTGQLNPETLYITGLVTKEAELKLLYDQGKKPAYSGISVLDVKITCEHFPQAEIHTVKKQLLPWKHIVCEIYDIKGKMHILHKKI